MNKILLGVLLQFISNFLFSQIIEIEKEGTVKHFENYRDSLIYYCHENTIKTFNFYTKEKSIVAQKSSESINTFAYTNDLKIIAYTSSSNQLFIEGIHEQLKLDSLQLPDYTNQIVLISDSQFFGLMNNGEAFVYNIVDHSIDFYKLSNKLLYSALSIPNSTQLLISSENEILLIDIKAMKVISSLKLKHWASEIHMRNDKIYVLDKNTIFNLTIRNNNLILGSPIAKNFSPLSSFVFYDRVFCYSNLSGKIKLEISSVNASVYRQNKLIKKVGILFEKKVFIHVLYSTIGGGFYIVNLTEFRDKS